MKGSPSVQKASPLNPKEQARAMSFNSRADAANGTNGGKSGSGPQYAKEGFTHSYSEAGAIGMMKSLHSK
jgi:hypothetical protein